MRELIRKFYNMLPSVWATNRLRNDLTYHLQFLQQIEQDRALRKILSDPKYEDSRRLTLFEHQVYSQTGEDGIIREIFQRIGTVDRSFLEIGVEGGLETNTTFLLMQGWKGTWIEGSSRRVSEIRHGFNRQLTNGRLQLVEAMVNRENVRGLIGSLDEVDMLSIDVDLNTYYVWEGLAHLRPRLVVVEYNGMMPAWLDWKVNYKPDQWWDGSKYMGASLKSLEILGRRMGYLLVGCTIAGINAFFVREDLVGEKFLAPFTAENHYEPDRQWLIRQNGHPASYAQFHNTD